jgi:acetyltransferase-like isoleucine patch superfamily enzyme
MKFFFKAKKNLARKFFDIKYRGMFRGHDFDVSFRCDNSEKFRFGQRCYIGPGCHFDALGGIEMDDFVIIGPHVKIWSYNHDITSEFIPYGPENKMLPVRIGKGVWIAMGAILLPGTEIGEGSVIGAGSIVHGKVPAFSLVRPHYAAVENLRVTKVPGLYYRDYGNAKKN